jgi:hypothetical protein
MHQQKLFAAGGTEPSSVGALALQSLRDSASLCTLKTTISNRHQNQLEIAVTLRKQSSERFSNGH